MSISKRSMPSLLRRVQQMMKSGNIEKPAWYDAALLVPPQRRTFNVPKPKRMQLQEQRLVSNFYRKSNGAEYKYLHLPGAESEGPAAAFVRRQMELMKNQDLSEREAFAHVQGEAEKSGALIDAAVNLAVTTSTERQQLLDTIDVDDANSVAFDQHVMEIAANVTDAHIAHLMKAERLSRQAAESKAMKQRAFDRRSTYEQLRKWSTDNQSRQGMAGQAQQQRRSLENKPKGFSDPLKVADQ